MRFIILLLIINKLLLIINYFMLGLMNDLFKIN